MIYDLNDEMLNLQESVMAPEGDFLDNDFEQYQENFEEKVEDYCKFIKNIEADIAGYEEEIKRLQAKKKRCESSVDWFKNLIEEGLNKCGKDKIKGKSFTVSMRNNAPQLPSELDFWEVPVAFHIPQEPKIDRKELLKAVKNGEVEGIELVRKKSLQIK